jgi:uracil-DNA glycosylase family 4
MVGPEGNPLTCRFVIVGEAPGEEEVRLGRPFVGPSGRALNILLESAGIDRKDCYLTNAVKERVHDLEWAQVMASRPALIEELKQVPISVPILALGGTARDALLGIHTGGVFEGRRWYTLHTGHEMLSTLHPAYLLRDHLEQAWMVVFDLQKLEVGRRPLPVQHIRMFTSIAEANAWLDGCESTLFSFDIETDWNDFQRSTILIIGIAYAQGEIVILPDTLIYNKSVIWKGDDNPVLPEHIKPEGVDFLSRLFGDTKRKFIAHNGL